MCEKNYSQKSSENHDYYVVKVFLIFMFFCVTMQQITCAIDINPKRNHFPTKFIQIENTKRSIQKKRKKQLGRNKNENL